MVVTRRMAMLTLNGVPSERILGITFTNKAANEMKERVSELTGIDNWNISTFHSFGARALREVGHLIEGRNSEFTICDAYKKTRLVANIMKTQCLQEKDGPSPIDICNVISKYKASQIYPDGHPKNKAEKIYEYYEGELSRNNMFDFDDLLSRITYIFDRHDDVLNAFRNRFDYVLVDEYQDTNTVQYKLAKLLSEHHRNLCVTGDPDQSIYGWRNADIKNILSFEDDFNDAQVIKLEENWRSTKNILVSAQKVIENNKERKEKNLLPTKDDGCKVTYSESNLYDDDEAEYISKEIKSLVDSGEYKYKDFAVLYRTNAQSRILEQVFNRKKIPHVLYGSTEFYSRMEIADLMAYLSFIANTKDDMSLTRAINTPSRGIGKTTQDKIIEFARENDMSMYEAVTSAHSIEGLNAGQIRSVGQFAYMIREIVNKEWINNIERLLETIIEITSYEDYLKHRYADTYDARAENIEELLRTARDFDVKLGGTLIDFLQETSLYAQQDDEDDEDDVVKMMTLHSSKGLEFPVVFLAGIEDGLLPHWNCSIEREIEEERRLFYVGITRAMEKLYLTKVNMRYINGDRRKKRKTMRSRFFKELPNECIHKIE